MAVPFQASTATWSRPRIGKLASISGPRWPQRVHSMAMMPRRTCKPFGPGLAQVGQGSRSGMVVSDGQLVVNLTAFRYLALNPGKARLAAMPADWPWSSTPAHFRHQDDGIGDCSTATEARLNCRTVLAPARGP